MLKISEALLSRARIGAVRGTLLSGDVAYAAEVT
jgi:hypothetical protein